MLISIDPGKHVQWWARWDSHARLVGAGRIKTPTGYDARVFLSQFTGLHLAIEKPMVKVKRAAKRRSTSRYDNARPGDIIDLAVRVGWCQAVDWATVTEYLPAEWKGCVPKDVHVARTRRSLSTAEVEVFNKAKIPTSLQHNLLDAVGIGLTYLRRKGLREE